MTSRPVTVVLAPVGGQALPLREVPDPVFAAALVGPGVAIDPARVGQVVAVSPVAGKLVKLHPHAFVVQTADGAGVLVHLGIDTIQLAGEGFDLLVAEGVEVASGEAVVAWNPAEVEAGGRSAVCPGGRPRRAAVGVVGRAGVGRPCRRRSPVHLGAVSLQSFSSSPAFGTIRRREDRRDQSPTPDRADTHHNDLHNRDEGTVPVRLAAATSA